MRKFLTLSAAALVMAGAANAQEARAPDGTPAFGIEPYFGVIGGKHSFDQPSDFNSPVNAGRFDGWLVGGVVGFNVPLGPLFAGVEGNAAKGFQDIDWEYGVRGRLGVRAGDSGLIYASAGYQWVNGKANRGFGDRHGMMYGMGVEFGPKKIGAGGVTGQAGPRLRLQVDTYDFQSIRPMAGVVFHF